MLNKVILKGSIGKTPEVKKTQDGRDVATFTLATHVSWKDANNEWQTHTDWHRIIVFKESTVRWIGDSLKKGDTLIVIGKLASYSKVGTDGIKRLVSRVVVSGWEGRVEYLRSSKTDQEQTSEQPQAL
jgi:single-strand DNA-binding protein